MSEECQDKLDIWPEVEPDSPEELEYAKTKHGKKDEVLRSLLSLVLEKPPRLCHIAMWTQRQKKQAERWAAREHLVASDNELRRFAKPGFLNRYK